MCERQNDGQGLATANGSVEHMKINARWARGDRSRTWDDLWRRILSDLVQDTAKHTSEPQSDEEKADD